MDGRTFVSRLKRCRGDFSPKTPDFSNHYFLLDRPDRSLFLRLQPYATFADLLTLSFVLSPAIKRFRSARFLLPVVLLDRAKFSMKRCFSGLLLTRRGKMIEMTAAYRHSGVYEPSIDSMHKGEELSNLCGFLYNQNMSLSRIFD